MFPVAQTMWTLLLAVAVSGSVSIPAFAQLPVLHAQYAGSEGTPLIFAMGDNWGRYDDSLSGWGRRPLYRSEGSCEPADALRQGRRAGLRSPGVKNVTSDFVVVGGRRGGWADEVVLINRPGCPYY